MLLFTGKYPRLWLPVFESICLKPCLNPVYPVHRDLVLHLAKKLCISTRKIKPFKSLYDYQEPVIFPLRFVKDSFESVFDISESCFHYTAVAFIFLYSFTAMNTTTILQIAIHTSTAHNGVTPLWYKAANVSIIMCRTIANGRKAFFPFTMP